MKNQSSLLKASAILWAFWGLVHIMAGVFTLSFILSGNIASSISGIADAVDPSTLPMEYPAAAGAIIGQHGFNLLWIGLITFISAIYIWKRNSNAIFLAAIVGGLADLGYFLFLDLGGFVKFMPGTLMTIVSASAITLSFIAYFRGSKATE
tara:strand:- start:1916 stop:2368 length:453 start_codon:yes stop_codon:yes gene_type:complete